MTPYEIFLKKHKAAPTEAAQMSLLKDYLFNLPNDEFVQFWTETPAVIADSARFIMQEGNAEDVNNLKKTLGEMQAILEKANQKPRQTA